MYAGNGSWNYKDDLDFTGSAHYVIPNNERTINPLLPLATEFKRLPKLSKAPGLFERDIMSDIISNIQRYLGRVRILLRVTSNFLYDVPRKFHISVSLDCSLAFFRRGFDNSLWSACVGIFIV